MNCFILEANVSMIFNIFAGFPAHYFHFYFDCKQLQIRKIPKNVFEHRNSRNG